MDDWFDKGKDLVIKQIADELDEDTSVVEAVYTRLVNRGLIDYDIEKDIFWDLVYDEEE